MRYSAIARSVFIQIIAFCLLISIYDFCWAGYPTTPPKSSEKVVVPPGEMITVRSPKESFARQGLPYFIGISQETAGAKGLSMNLVVIPPGGSAKPHIHRGYETAIYLLEGHVETFYGPGLKKSMINEKGDFIFIPADVPHQPRNLSSTDPAVAIVARNDPNEQESVVYYVPSEDK